MGDTMTVLDPILTEIEDALVAHDVSATRFGYLVAGDPALIPRMRGGRRVRGPMRKKIIAALKRLEEKGDL
jgi:uncharacterized protein (UPF0297 family)